jgi:hypothetical protein
VNVFHAQEVAVMSGIKNPMDGACSMNKSVDTRFHDSVLLMAK